MVGNDVVDLGDPDTQPDARHPRFDQRVFAPAELGVIRTSDAPCRVRWLLWAAKESAFKLLRKLNPTVVFAPRRFVVRVHAGFPLPAGAAPALVSGTVTHEDRSLVFEAVAAHRLVHAITTREPAELGAAVTALRCISSECPSATVRRLAMETLAPRLGVEAHELEVIRDGRVPRLHWCGRPAPVDLSLSHHGCFVAVAALFDGCRGAT